jgi:hypothetical protein
MTALKGNRQVGNQSRSMSPGWLGNPATLEIAPWAGLIVHPPPRSGELGEA